MHARHTQHTDRTSKNQAGFSSVSEKKLPRSSRGSIRSLSEGSLGLSGTLSQKFGTRMRRTPLHKSLFSASFPEPGKTRELSEGNCVDTFYEGIRDYRAG